MASTSSSPLFQLSVTPTQNLTDGEPMTITVTRTAAGTAAGLEITWVAFAWCTPTFTPPAAPAPISTVPATSSFPTQWSITGAHCTTKGHPLSGDILPQTVIAPPVNSTGDYATVTGHLPAETSEGTKLYTRATATSTGFDLVCDATHPCRFAVAVFTRHQGTRAQEPPVFLSVPVTFATAGLLTGCEGDAPGSVTSASPDLFGQAVTGWTIGACKAGLGGGSALTGNTASGQSDASALEGFANGTDDLAYSAVGYGASGAFTPSVDRPFVAVPVAIDAVVLGHVQAYAKTSPGGHTVLGDYPQQLRITDAQAAQLLGGGPTSTALKWSNPLGQALIAENPELRTGGSYYSASLPITQRGTTKQDFGIVATSLVDATSFFATTYFHTLVPHAMVSRRTAAQLGITADFGTATPPFNIDATTTSSLIAKALTPNAGQGFALLDAATAASLWGGLADFALQAPSSIGTGNPVYVSPTEASMDAATTEMIPQDDGTLLPNPDATPVNGVQPYPLTFVEYAIAPAQPLLTPTCTPRTSSQRDLTAWLDYITGPGQSQLPAGMEPLTPALGAQAQAAIAEVGTAKTTGSCASVKSTSGSQTGSTGGTGTPQGGTVTAAPGTAGASGASAGGGAFAAGSFGSNGFGSTGGGTGGSGTSSPGSSHGKGHVKGHAVPATLAGFNRVEGLGWLLPALGVLVLVLLLPGLAFLMSGRSLRLEVEGPGGPAGPATMSTDEGPEGAAGDEDPRAGGNIR